jgi:predicted ATPase
VPVVRDAESPGSTALQTLQRGAAAHLRGLRRADPRQRRPLHQLPHRAPPAALGAELLEADDLLEPDPDDDDQPSFPIAPRFVGHKPLVERLLATVKQAQKASELAFVALTGPPGVGKSRLARELGRLLADEAADTRVLEAICGGPGAPPYAAFQRLFGDRLGIAAGETAGAARARINAAVAELLPASRATEVSHLLGQLLDYPFPDSAVVEPLAETPSQLESRTFIAVRRFLAADAARRPLVLVLDEIERASPETVNLLHYLAAGLASSPVVLLVVGRPTLFDAHPSFGEGDVTLSRIEMGPLSDVEAAELFRELIRPAGEPPGELARHARERLGGTPRSLVELVRYLLEVGAIHDPSGKGKWRFDRIRLLEAPLPDELEEILAAACG